MLALVAVVYVERVVCARDYGKLARVVKVKGGDISFRIVGFEPLVER